MHYTRSRAGKSVDRNQVNLPLKTSYYKMAIFVPTIDLLPGHKGAETHHYHSV